MPTTDGSQPADRRVALLTNTRTANLGNQVLSTAMIDLFGTRYAEVVPLHRCPEVFASDLPWQVDRRTAWADAVRTEATAALAPPAPVPALERSASTAPAPSAEVQITRRGGRLVGKRYSRRRRMAHWARWNTPVRRYFSVTERAAARHQFATVLACDEVVYNPAGELMSAGRPVSRLFELALARESGRPHAAVNFTYEPMAEIWHLTAEVLGGADAVFVRERSSANRLVRDGAPAGRVEVVPDAAFLYEPPTTGQGGRGVAIAVNASLDSARRRSWAEMIAGFLADGRRVEFVSNEHDVDAGFAAELSEELGHDLPVSPDFRHFEDYAAYIGAFDLVVTGRFHTGVLASLMGRPVIGIEGASRRLQDGLVTAVPAEQLLTMDSSVVGAVRALSRDAAAALPSAIADTRARIRDAYGSTFPLGDAV